MKVAFDFTPVRMNPAGTGRYARGVARALEAEPGIELHAIEASQRRPAHAAGRILQGLFRELLYYPMLADARARAVGADVLHVPAALGPMRPRMPVVVTIHDLLALRQPELFTRELLLHARLVLPRVARAAARVITVSEHARRDILELLDLPAEHVVAIHNGVDPVFSPRAAEDHALSERFGVRRPYVLATGTLEPRKNLTTVLEALSRLPDEAMLVVAGARGWRAAEIDGALERSGARARRLGFVSDEDLATLYSCAACFVFPSLSEGFGLPPLEAMACGAPVVCSKRASLPEVVGDAAILLDDPEDPAALAAAVERVLSDAALAEDLRARGRERARAFTWERAARRTREVYERARG